MSLIPTLKAQVGIVSSGRHAKLSEKEMRDFASVVRATHGNTNHSAISSRAIPTIFTRFREGEFELLTKLGVELKQVLHAEQEYRFEASLAQDEEIRYETELRAVTEKKGKDVVMAFMIFETPFVRVSDGTVVARAKSTIVFRSPKASS